MEVCVAAPWPSEAAAELEFLASDALPDLLAPMDPREAQFFAKYLLPHGDLLAGKDDGHVKLLLDVRDFLSAPEATPSGASTREYADLCRLLPQCRGVSELGGVYTLAQEHLCQVACSLGMCVLLGSDGVRRRVVCSHETWLWTSWRLLR